VAAALAAERAEGAGLAEQVQTVRAVEGMRATLAERQSGSHLALHEARLLRLRAEADQRRHGARLAELGDRAQQIAAERAAFEAGLRRAATEALAEARPRLRMVDEALAKARALRATAEIVAPRPGMVLRVAEGGAGSLVAAGEPVVVLVPADAPLRAEIGLRSGDAGRVRAGDRVALKIDAFPWKRHGILPGRLSDVGHASFTPEGAREALHPAHVALSPDGLPDGAALLPGMTLVAEIHTGTRSVLAFFLDPVLRGLAESLREP
jgi:HlyD family secretion protein